MQLASSLSCHSLLTPCMQAAYVDQATSTASELLQPYHTARSELPRPSFDSQGVSRASVAGGTLCLITTCIAVGACRADKSLQPPCQQPQVILQAAPHAPRSLAQTWTQPLRSKRSSHRTCTDQQSGSLSRGMAPCLSLLSSSSSSRRRLTAGRQSLKQPHMGRSKQMRTSLRMHTDPLVASLSRVQPLPSSLPARAERR